MNTVQFFDFVVNWLLADPAHVVMAASVIAALTPTPRAGSLAAKLYQVVDLLALNVLRAKNIGESSVPRADQSSPRAPGIPPADQSSPRAPGSRGFSRLGPALMLALIGALLALGGCSAVQGAFSSALSTTVNGVTTVSQDAIAAGKAAICNSSYQVVANQEVNDPSGMGKAVPALCPAVVPVATAVPLAAVPSGTASQQVLGVPLAQGPTGLTGQPAGQK